MKRGKIKRLARKAALAAAASGLALIMCCTLTGCGGIEIEGETITYTDSCDREVELPADLTRIAPSGSVAEMILMTVAPEYLVGLANSPSNTLMKYYPEETWTLPTFGQFYGSKATLNMEALIAADPQIIIDLGDMKTGHKKDMDAIQKQTGIPTIFIETSLDNFPQAYRDLGKLLGKEEKCEEMARFIEDTVAMAEENSAKIKEEDRKTVYYGTGAAGLDCNASGSSQSDVIDIVGAVNAIQVKDKDVTNAGGGTPVNMEELYKADPDVIILTEEGPYDELTVKSKGWTALTAVEKGDFYEIPGEPYCWMSGPPSVNRILGIYWLGNLLYPDLYDFDMVEVAQEFYGLFYDYELTDEAAEALLANSTLK